MWFGGFSGYLQKFKYLNKSFGVEGMWNIIVPLLVKLSFEFVINSKMDFSSNQNVKNLIFTLNFSFLV